MVAYNCRHFIFKDKEIRRALSYAIDKMGFIYKVLEQRADAARGPFNSDFWAYESSLESFKYNPKKYPFGPPRRSSKIVILSFDGLPQF